VGPLKVRILPVDKREGNMSYDIYLKDPITKETICFDESHQFAGGTYELGGTREAWLNVTYNYGKHYYRVFGEKGIRTLYGLTGTEAIPFLKDAVSKLKDDASEDYWEATEGNAKQALLGLLAYARMRPDGIFDGD